MENIVHFGHEHPLILKEFEELTHDCCNACGLYLLSSPSYICSIQDCNFYLHQACAQLPPKSDHYFSSSRLFGRVVEKHALALLAKPRDDNWSCGDCGKLCKNFTYHCSECEFVLHPLCGSPLDIQIKHISHPQHPMVALCKEALLLCDICGKEHKGYFFSCHLCHFWIHQDCALLPTFIKVQKHHHHLSLLYSIGALLPMFIKVKNRDRSFSPYSIGALSNFDISDSNCLICGEMALKRFGFYYCFICRVMAHVDCTASQMKDSGAILHLPTMLADTFPSLIMHTGVKEKAIQESNSENMLEKYHPHSLVPIDGTAQESICNACIKPISPPYYKCGDPSECDFLLHKFCADLPLSIKHLEYKSKTCSLAFPRWDEFFSLFQCYHCKKYNNGFGFGYTISFTDRVVDIDCALAPIVIKHDSHKQHPLILVAYSFGREVQTQCCDKINCYIYHCGVCNFSIHIDCARLPKTVTHKFDKHPLTLTFTSSSQHHSDSTDHICEFCEEHIDLNYWFYHCAQCDQSFHVNCIPSVGKFSNIKFGGTVKVPCHNDHPLTLVRMLSIGSQTCGYCHEIIEGFKDGMALHCTDCDFWIHFKCGNESSGATVSRPYRDLSRSIS